MRDGVLLTLALLCLATSASVAAPDTTYDVLNRGSVLIGGSVSIRNSVAAPQMWSSSQFNANPRLMYYVAPSLALGVALDYWAYTHNVSLSEIGFGPRLGYYFGRSDAKSHLFVESGLCIRGRDSDDERWFGGGIDVTFGLISMVGSSWGTEVKVGYLWESLSRGGHAASDGVFGIGGGIVGWARKPEDLK